MEHSVAEQDFRLKCEFAGEHAYTNKQLAGEFGISVHVVRYLKRKWGLTGSSAVSGHDPTGLPSVQELSERWVRHGTVPGSCALYQLKVPEALSELSSELGISQPKLLKHMKHVGFDHKHPWGDEMVEKAVREILSKAWGARRGMTFLLTTLRTEYDMVPRKSQVKRIYAQVGPQDKWKRSVKTKKKRPYNVRGPRSLYHLDAHEKLAKIWGTFVSKFLVLFINTIHYLCFHVLIIDTHLVLELTGFWIHGCIDGYSRKIIYLRVTDNKRSDTLEDIYLEAMNNPDLGWAARNRFDKGKVTCLILLTILCMVLYLQAYFTFLYVY